MKDQARPHLDAPDSGDDGTLSDERILARFVSGDEEALGELARRYEGLLLGLCTGMLGDRALAMEAVQETWLRVIRHSRTYDGRASVKTWVYQIAMNRCRDLGRSRSASKKRERVHHDRLQDEKKAHVIPTASPVDPRLEAAVGALEEHQRETVILCYHRGLTHRQAAEVFGCADGHDQESAEQGLEKLRESLGTQDAVPRPGGRGMSDPTMDQIEQACAR